MGIRFRKPSLPAVVSVNAVWSVCAGTRAQNTTTHDVTHARTTINTPHTRATGASYQHPRTSVHAFVPCARTTRGRVSERPGVTSGVTCAGGPHTRTPAKHRLASWSSTPLYGNSSLPRNIRCSSVWGRPSSARQNSVSTASVARVCQATPPIFSTGEQRWECVLPPWHHHKARTKKPDTIGPSTCACDTRHSNQ